MIKELDCVALAEDLPASGLKKNDLGTVVLVHPQDKGYEIEFQTLEGDTVTVVSLYPHQIRSVGSNEIAQARTLSAA